MNGSKNNRPGLTRRQLLATFGGTFAGLHAANYVLDEIELLKFRNVQTAANDIIESIEKRLETLPAEKTLFVPVGENHSRPSHRLVQQALLQGLKERGHAIALGYEVDYDLLAETKIPFADQHTKDQLLAGDPDGENALRMISNKDGMFLGSYPSMQNLFRFCLDQKISTSFNDLAKIYGLKEGVPLDPQDPQTIFFQALSGAEKNTVFDVVEPQGMRLRNLAMVFNGIAHAREEKARIYVQLCGSAHVMGDKVTDNVFDDSLTNLYAAAGQDVLPVFLSTDILSLDIEAFMYMLRNKTVVISDLDDKEFTYIWLPPQNEALIVEEIAHMRFLARHTNLRIYDGKAAEFQETPYMKTLTENGTDLMTVEGETLRPRTRSSALGRDISGP